MLMTRRRASPSSCSATGSTTTTTAGAARSVEAYLVEQQRCLFLRQLWVLLKQNVNR